MFDWLVCSLPDLYTAALVILTCAVSAGAAVLVVTNVVWSARHRARRLPPVIAGYQPTYQRDTAAHPTLPTCQPAVKPPPRRP